MKTRSWLVACLLVVMGAGNAQEGGKTPREELEKRLASSQNIQALGDDLFGDAVALQNGALSFSATDVSIPGNSALPVAFARTYTAFNRWGYGDTGSRLGDWDIDLPNISGVFAPNWTISDPYLNSTSGARCSSGRLPTQPLDDYTVRDFWHGNTLHIPGGGGGEILSPNGGPMPTNGTTYKWVTADNFRLTCLATINNGTGEGFLALAPDGTKYWFNHMAQYKEPRLEMIGRQAPSGGPDVNPVQRRKNVLYATRVEDQFGNWVEYDFSNNWNEAAKLYAIRSSDNRRIDITYVSERVSTVATGTRSWSYHYGVTPSGRRTLTSVVLPDHTRWQLTLGPLTDAHIKYPPGGISERDCITNDTPENNAQQFAGRMVHPSGAIGDFRAGIRLHGRANVLMVCENVTGVPPPSSNVNDPRDDVNAYVISYDSISLIGKTISGPVLESREWTYQYGHEISFVLPKIRIPNYRRHPSCTPFTIDNCFTPQCVSDDCAGQGSRTTIRESNGRWTRYTFGNSYRYNEGKLLKTETGMGASEVAVTSEERFYDLSLDDQAYPATYGGSYRDEDESFATQYIRPQLGAKVTQQGATFEWQVDTGCGSGSHCFDAWARPLKVTRSSSLGYSKTESTEYHDNYNKWVLSQVARTRLMATSLPISSPLPKETSRVEFSPTTAQPLRTFAFGKLQQTLAYHPDGTLASVSDGRDSAAMDTSIMLSDWKRGIPQLVKYPATPGQPLGTSRTAGVDDNGWITAVSDERGSRTCYGYTVAGRINSVTQTSEAQSGVCNGSAWAPTTLTFGATGAAIYGLPQNHWVQVVTTGNGKRVTRYDAMWRPVVEETFDAGDAAATRSIVAKRYDQAGRLAFQSHPMRTLADYRTVSTGTTTTYDALDRVTEVRVPSVDAPEGVFKTKMEYLSGFVQRTTSPNNAVTTTRFMAWDEPTAAYPARIEHPEAAVTVIQRNGLGRPVALTRSGTSGTPSLTRSYVYRPDTEELCKTIEPETGVTVMDHDASGNLGWSAAGLDLADPVNCNLTQAWNSGRRVLRSYDARNRLSALVFPDGNGNQAWSYHADGKPSQISTWNIGLDGAEPKETRNLYTFHRRGLLKTEVIAVPAWYTFSVEHGYNANGHLNSESYPSGRSLSYAVNALGQTTVITSPSEGHTYANSITYLPNGAVERFIYGNGIEHRMAQNDRQLPDSSRASYGSTEFVWDELDYDGHGNVLAVADLRPGKAGRRSRTMDYDDLDRLTQVASPMFGASGATYTYNVFDDPTRVKIGGAAARDHYYCYDAARRLANVKTGGCGGATVIGLGYDVQGNLQNKNGQQYRFDFGNRLREVDGVERYRYDGHGRRVLAMTFNEGNVLSQYAFDGKLMFQQSARTGLQSDMVYLAGSLLAIREEPGSGGTPVVKYQHTDALGSPVVVTLQNRAIVEETEYEPYGKVLNRPVHDGPGYTGHVEDAATGLTYMQQRYYDPAIGKFLSVDPVTANPNTGASFNRYNYANNNPYRFTDPDGRQACVGQIPKFQCMGGANPAGPNPRQQSPEDRYSLGLEVKGDARIKEDFKKVEEKAKAAGMTIFDDLRNASAMTYVVKGATTGFEGGSKDGKRAGIVRWNPSEGALIQSSHLSGSSNRRNQSPALGLIHELGHAEMYLIQGDMSNPALEYPVIFGVETEWANAYGEPVRDPLRAHGGLPVLGKGLFDHD